MKSKLFPLLFLLLLPVAASAQEQESSWLVRTARKGFRSLTEPNKSLDSVYVLQPTFKWVVAVESEYFRTGANLNSDIILTDLRDNDPIIVNGTMKTQLVNDPYRKVGLAAGYGSLRMGYGIQLGKKKEGDQFFSLGLVSSFYGVQARYNKVRHYPEIVLDVDGQKPITLEPDDPGEMRLLSVEGFYAFNRHRFVYTAAYDGRILQRRSAGSWLVAAQYTQGVFSLGEDYLLRSTLNNLERYSTQQVSLGGGYSYNWVIFHRDPTDRSRFSDLRNLTLNATAQCNLSFLNNIQTEQVSDSGTEKVRYKGQPSLTPIIQGGLCYTLGRFSFCAAVSYDRFGFQGIDTDVNDDDGYLRTKVKTQGTFFNFNVEGKVNVRF